MISKIKNKLKTNDGKVLLENFISLSLLQVVGYILPLITLPYIAKTVGVENFGALAFASSVIVFFQTLTDYGFNYTGIRDTARVRDDKIKTSFIFSRIVFSRFLLTILGFIILILLIELVPQLHKNYKLLLYTFLLVPGYSLYPEWFFQAIEKMKYSAILSTIIKIIFTISIFVFIKEEDDYIYIPIINAIGFFVVGLCAFYLIIFKYEYKIVKVKFSDLYLTIKDSTNVFISLILPNLYTNMSVIFLEKFWGKSHTGLFDAGNKFIGISQQITNVLSRTFYPLLSRRIDKHKLYELISFSVSIVIACVLFFSAEFIVDFFYGKTFNDTVTVIKIMAISPIFIFMMNAYGTNYLVIKGKENVLRNIVTICSLFGFVLTYILVTRYSFIGASIAITTVWGIRGVTTLYYAKKIKI